MARTRTRGFRRRGKRTLWTGIGPTDIVLPAAGAPATVLLWDPALYTQLGIANVTLERIVGNLSLIGRAAVAVQRIFWYIGVFDTDVTDTVPAALIPNPATADVDMMEKKDLFFFGTAQVPPPGFAAGQRIEINVKAKRRIGGNKAVMLAISGFPGVAGDEARLTMQARLLAGFGPK